MSVLHVQWDDSGLVGSIAVGLDDGQRNRLVAAIKKARLRLSVTVRPEQIDFKFRPDMGPLILIGATCAVVQGVALDPASIPPTEKKRLRYLKPLYQVLGGALGCTVRDQRYDLLVSR